MSLSSTKYLIKEGFKNVWNNRIMSIASICVMMSCLILTGSALLVSINVNSLLEGVESQNNIRVFLDASVATIDALKIGLEIKKISNIDECKFVSKEETAEDFSEVLGEGPLSEGLSGEGNPFPHTYVISLFDLSLYDETIQSIKNIEGVDTITDMGDVVKKLTKINKVVSIIGIVLFAVLGMVSLFILSNTIKLTMYSRRLEIAIMRSVGATDWFIRIPFIVESAVIGIVASVLSSVVLRFVGDRAINFLKDMTVFSKVKFYTVTIDVTMGFVLAGVLFSVVCGMLTMNKYLRREQSCVSSL